MNKNRRSQHKSPVFLHKSIFELVLVVLFLSVLILEKCEHKAVVNNIFVEQQIAQEKSDLLGVVMASNSIERETTAEQLLGFNKKTTALHSQVVFDNRYLSYQKNGYDIRYKAIKQSGKGKSSAFVVDSKKVYAFNPGGIATGLQLWLKANDGVSTVGENISSWLDRSTNNNTITPHSSNRAPNVISTGANFNPYLDFNEANNDRINGPNYNLSGSSVPYQLFFVYKVEGAQPSGVYPGLWDWDGVGGYSRIETFNEGFYNTNGVVLATSSINYGKWNLAIANSHSGNLSTRLNGLNGSELTDSSTNFRGNGNVSIGINGQFNGEIAEIIYYSLLKKQE